MSIDWQPENPETRDDPYPTLARMRAQDPCHWSPRLKAWVLTRYDDVRNVCVEKERYSSNRLQPFFAALPRGEADRMSDLVRYLSLWMVFQDPPDHTRLRRLVGKVFTARAMQGARPTVEAIATRLIEAIGDADRFDFIERFAGPLPCMVIIALLGVPPEDLDAIKRMSDDIALFIGAARLNSDRYATAQAATAEMAAYFRRLIALRRAEPGDDLLSQLIAIREGDDALADDELVATCILMLFAGHETTTNHIANGLWSLLRFPDQMQALRADPGLSAHAVEELLRHEGPSGALVRVATETHALHGRTIEAGDRVFMLIHAANRDPDVYPDPDRLDLRRDGAPHLTFGYGPHLCLGFPLARTEGQVAFPALLRAFRDIEAVRDRQQWLDSMVFRAMTALEVQVRRH